MTNQAPFFFLTK
jgi:hypothetical protein